MLVGTDALGVPDPAGTFTITVRRLAGTPLNHSTVVLDFLNVPDLTLSATQPGTNFDAQCMVGYQYVRGITGSDGTVTFTLLGHANHANPDAGHASLDIYADGVRLGTIPVSAFDQDGDGLGPADNALWLQDYFTPQYLERSDFDGDGVLGPNDLSLWLAAFFGDGSVANGATSLCP